MANATTSNRAYPLPNPENIAAEDAARIATALGKIDQDMAAALDQAPQSATEVAAGVVRLATLAEAGAGTETNAVPSVARVKAMVLAAIAAIVGDAPDALNTVYEIAAALEDNEDVVATIQSAIGKKADSTALTAAVDSLNTALAAKANASDVTTALTAKQDKLGFTPANKAGDAFTGAVSAPSFTASGELKSQSGVLRLSVDGTKYLYWDGTNYVLGSQGNIWHTGNFNPASYATAASISSRVESGRFVFAGEKEANNFLNNWSEPFNGAVVTAVKASDTVALQYVRWRYMQLYRADYGGWFTIGYA
jgi:hypothetical protein